MLWSHGVFKDMAWVFKHNSKKGMPVVISQWIFVSVQPVLPAQLESQGFQDWRMKSESSDSNEFSWGSWGLCIASGAGRAVLVLGLAYPTVQAPNSTMFSLESLMLQLSSRSGFWHFLVGLWGLSIPWFLENLTYYGWPELQEPGSQPGASQALVGTLPVDWWKLVELVIFLKTP